jgi:hypothetical protein
MAHHSWGPGWPNAQFSRINPNFRVLTHWGWTKFPGGVRRELEELLTRLIQETSNRGYYFGVEGNPSYGCWGFGNRAIRGSHSPSNHSWGLAVDINAPKNPMNHKLITDMPAWMPDLWNAYGFRWGGDYETRPDAMHYEFMLSIDDAIRLTITARLNLLGEIRNGLPQPQPEPIPEPTKPKDDNVYVLVKGDASEEIWLTDMQTKRLMKDKEEANFSIMVINGAGGTSVKTANGSPEIWPQKYIDRIARSDDNLLEATLKWEAGKGQGPIHDIVSEVLGKFLPKSPTPEPVVPEPVSPNPV